MNIERLTMLADYLEGKGVFAGRAPKENKFDLERWMDPYYRFSDEITKRMPYCKDKPAFKIVKKLENEEHYGQLIPVDCQTAGCAVGWAASQPEFIEMGLTLRGGKYITPTIDFDNSTGLRATERFFDLSMKETIHLFCKTSYDERPTTIIVANRIRKFIEDNR